MAQRTGTPFASLADALHDELIQKFDEAGEEIVKEAKAAARVDTGELQASIYHSVDDNNGEVSLSIGARAQNPNNGAYYGMFWERGFGGKFVPGGRDEWYYTDRHGIRRKSVGHAADPFMEPSVASTMGAIDQMGGAIAGIVNGYIEKNFERLS